MWVSFPWLWWNTWKKIKGRQVYFGSQFQSVFIWMRNTTCFGSWKTKEEGAGTRHLASFYCLSGCKPINRLIHWWGLITAHLVTSRSLVSGYSCFGTKVYALGEEFQMQILTSIQTMNGFFFSYSVVARLDYSWSRN